LGLLEQDESTRRPKAAEVIARAIDARMLRLHTLLPAKVTSYDASKQKVSIQPLIKEPYLDEDDSRQIESMPVISGVPVVFLSAGGFRFTCPISDGSLIIEGKTIPATTGCALFAERSMDRWLSGSGQEVDPAIDHMHKETDAVFIPGLNPFGAPLQSCPTDHATAGADAGQQIHFHNSIICIGDESGSDFIAMAQKVMQNFSDLKSRFNALETAITVPVVNTAAVGQPDLFQAKLITQLGLHPYPTPGEVKAAVGKVK